MEPKSLRVLYFEWLIEQLKLSSNHVEHYLTVFSVAHSIPFEARVKGDSNRVEDGLALRVEFMNDLDFVGPDDEPLNLVDDERCTVLEMLVGLSGRLCELAFSANSSTTKGFWFIMLMDNLKISSSIEDEEYISKAFTYMVTRNYHVSGKGGLFPLRRPKEDQRTVELWMQMNQWFLENYV